MVKYTRPLTTHFKAAKTKAKLAAMARDIADLADAPRIEASPDKAYTYKVHPPWRAGLLGQGNPHRHGRLHHPLPGR